MKKIWKSADIWRSYRKRKHGDVFETQFISFLLLVCFWRIIGKVKSLRIGCTAWFVFDWGNKNLLTIWLFFDLHRFTRMTKKGHSLQFLSSDQSPQSLSLSQTHVAGIQRPRLWHSNWSSRHTTQSHENTVRKQCRDTTIETTIECDWPIYSNFKGQCSN